MSWLKKAWRSVKHVTTAVVAAPAHVLVKIPIVGKPLRSVYNLTTGPIDLAMRVAGGARIDHAVMGNLKAQVRDVKVLAPYAQTIVSLVPGVGTGVSAAFSAGIALADGKPLTEAVVSGIKGSLPGGPAAQAAFAVTAAAATGKRLDQAAIAALPISDHEKQALSKAAAVVTDVAKGKRVDHAVFEQAQSALPPAVRDAMQVGVAVGQGVKMQRSIVKSKEGDALIVRGDKSSGAFASGIALAEGVRAADRVLDALNNAPGTTAAAQAHAKEIVENTGRIAKDPKHRARAGAINGLTLLKKRAAAKRAALTFKVDAHGFVRPA